MSDKDFSNHPPAVAASGAGTPDPQAPRQPAPPTSSPGDAAAGWVQPCRVCDGDGTVMRDPSGHANDPDNWPVTCAGCDGEGHFPCEVCGNSVPVDGFDCFACETVDGLPLGMSKVQLKILHDAIGVGFARAAESYVPTGKAA